MTDADRANLQDFLTNQLPAIVNTLSSSLSDDAAPVVAQMGQVTSRTLGGIINRGPLPPLPQADV